MLLFMIFGAMSIVASLGVILIRKPIYSALFLLLNFSSLAVLYVMLQAQFLAAVQVIVYAGAIVVLFLFVVMLVGGGELGDMKRLRNPLASRITWPRIAALLLILVLVAALGYTLTSGAGKISSVSGEASDFGQGSVQAIGAALFTDYLFPFELTLVLLLVGMIGAVVLTKHE
jgi:NADH-quinone oxidoreductase subunit J